MIKLHHLNKSRSKRILWLLEEIGQAYEVVPYLRNTETFLAPPELCKIHPLGKSPVIEVDGQVLAESGAITEYLIERYAPGRLAPERDSEAFAQYLYWIHFAESSAILPLLLKLFVEMDGCETNFMAGYAQIEINKVIGHLENSLAEKDYLVGDKLSGADIMISFIVDLLTNNGMIKQYPNIEAYQTRLEAYPGYQTAAKTEIELG